MLEIRNVTKMFGGVRAVNNVSLDVPVGAVHGLVGPNGAGKSTLFGIVAGQIRATSGTIEWEGVRISGMHPEQIASCGIARSFQTSRLFSGLSVLENVATGGVANGSTNYLEDLTGSRRRSREWTELRQRAGAMVGLVGLGQQVKENVSSLSYGQRRLVEIARALMLRPRMLLLDEPAAGLNTHEADQLGEVLRGLTASLGLGVLLVDHNLQLVLKVCDRVAVLNFGTLIANETASELVNNSAFVEAYAGSAGDVK